MTAPSQEWDDDLDRCPADPNNSHRWTVAEPPEWMDTSVWDTDAWESWYDEAERHCWYCGMTDG
jgi:hypothetical protein